MGGNVGYDFFYIVLLEVDFPLEMIHLKLYNLSSEKPIFEQELTTEETWSIARTIEKNQIDVNPQKIYWDRSQISPLSLGDSIIKLQQKYGNHWVWYTKTMNAPLLGGDSARTEWILNGILAFLFWLILMVSGFTSLFAEYYRVGIEKVILLIDKFMNWDLGPEDPFLYLMRKIARAVGWFASVATSFLLIWYLVARWSYGLFYIFYDNCRSTYMQNIFGNIIASIFVLYFVIFSSGSWVIQKMRQMSSLPAIGPLMEPLSNLYQKLWFALRKPRFIPYYGPAVSGYFTGLEKGVPMVSKVMKPLKTLVSNLPLLVQLTAKEPYKSLIEQSEAEKIVKYLSYEYLSLPEKAAKNFNYSQKMTSRFIEWTVMTLSASAAGGMYLLTNICTGDQVRKLEDELMEIASDEKMDPEVRDAKISEKQLEIQSLREDPDMNADCIIDKVESGALAGHATFLWTLLLMIIFIIFPPKPR